MANRQVQTPPRQLVGRSKTLISTIPLIRSPQTAVLAKAIGTSSFETSGLPLGFADEVMRLEMDIDLSVESIDIAVIHRLIELYTVAVGYYESIGDLKYAYFGKKINSLMMKPIVMDSMSKAAIPRRRAATAVATPVSFVNEVKHKEESVSNQKITGDDQERQRAKSTVVINVIDQIVLEEEERKVFGASDSREGNRSIVETKIDCSQIVISKPLQQIKKQAVEEVIKMNIMYRMDENTAVTKNLLKNHATETSKIKETINQQMNVQVDDIKKRLESRRLTQKALSLPNQGARTADSSDVSLSDIDGIPLLQKIQRRKSSDKVIHEVTEEEDQEEFQPSRRRTTMFKSNTSKDKNPLKKRTASCGFRFFQEKGDIVARETKAEIQKKLKKEFNK